MTFCQWFAHCENEATTTKSHPVLGAVPACDRCAAKIDRIAASTNQPH